MIGKSGSIIASRCEARHAELSGAACTAIGVPSGLVVGRSINFEGICLSLFVCNALVDLKQRSIYGLSPCKHQLPRSIYELSPCKHQLPSSSLDGCLSAPPATQVFTAPILADATNGVFSATQFIREVT
jgi:hypothetical protein